MTTVKTPKGEEIFSFFILCLSLIQVYSLVRGKNCWLAPCSPGSAGILNTLVSAQEPCREMTCREGLKWFLHSLEKPYSVHWQGAERLAPRRSFLHTYINPHHRHSPKVKLIHYLIFGVQSYQIFFRSSIIAILIIIFAVKIAFTLVSLGKHMDVFTDSYLEWGKYICTWKFSL